MPTLNIHLNFPNVTHVDLGDLLNTRTLLAHILQKLTEMEQKMATIDDLNTATDAVQGTS